MKDKETVNVPVWAGVGAIVTQASAAFLTLRTALSIIVDQFNSLRSFAAVVERLGGYLEAGDIRRPSVAAEASKWKDLLSLREQQKVAFARLLLDHPGCAFLDEATSALDAGQRDPALPTTCRYRSRYRERADACRATRIPRRAARAARRRGVATQQTRPFWARVWAIGAESCERSLMGLGNVPAFPAGRNQRQ